MGLDLANTAVIPRRTKMNETPAKKSQEFYCRYAVAGVEQYARKCRNAYVTILRAYAESCGKRLSKGLVGATYAVGGSIGYDALLKGCYDVDLRILLPENAGADEIDSVVLRLILKEGFQNPRFIDEGGTNYIWHVGKQVRVPALAARGGLDVELTVNVQSCRGYGGIAATSALMPRIVIDRYVVAKALSKKEGAACYTAVKEYWKVFIRWAQARGVDRMKPGAIAKLLDKNADLFPLFLKEKK